MKTAVLFFALVFGAIAQAEEPKKPDLFELSLPGFVLEPTEKRALDFSLTKVVREDVKIAKEKKTAQGKACTVCDAEP